MPLNQQDHQDISWWQHAVDNNWHKVDWPDVHAEKIWKRGTYPYTALLKYIMNDYTLIPYGSYVSYSPLAPKHRQSVGELYYEGACIMVETEELAEALRASIEEKYPGRGPWSRERHERENPKRSRNWRV